MAATCSQTLLPCDVENGKCEVVMVMEAGTFEGD